MKITKTQKRAMSLVKDGADIKCPKLAKTLRSVQRNHPSLIQITRPMGNYGVWEPHPWFGAILTDAGRAAVAK